MTALDEVAKQPGMEAVRDYLTAVAPVRATPHTTHHLDCGCITAQANAALRALADALAEAQADLVTAEAGEHRLAHAAQLLGWQMECERAMREVAEATIETLRGGPDIAVFVGNECVCRSCTTVVGSNSTCVHHWERFVTTGSNFRCRFCGATKL